MFVGHASASGTRADCRSRKRRQYCLTVVPLCATLSVWLPPAWSHMARGWTESTHRGTVPREVPAVLGLKREVRLRELTASD
jgi:hypothetical protein